MRITAIETDLLRVPLRRPVALPASQDPRAAKEVDLLVVRVLTAGGPTGVGLTYTFGGGPAVRAVLDDLAPRLVGEDASRTEWLYVKARAELEGVGFAGLAARAYAGVDFALWDWKGKRAGLPVAQLLGGYRGKLKGIVSDTATPALGAKQAAKETRAALDAGAAGVLAEVGTQDPDLDVERVRQLREAVPEGAWFELSGCGRYDLSTGLWMGRVFEDEFAADGYADPLRPDDLDGLARLGDRLEVALSVGALYDRPDDFLRVLDRGGVSAVRIDPVRLGGLTPARKVAAAAELRHVAVVPVRLPEVGVHLAGGVPLGRVCEYVDWFGELYAGGPRFAAGQLVVPDGPGLGLTLDDAAVARHRV
jgi:L-alanine-DL-glutamate epimerase-like enolase superfamily enzyme